MTNSARLRAPYWIALFGSIFAIVVTAGAALFVTKLHNGALNHSEAELKSLSVILSEQTARTFDTASTIQSHIIDRVTSLAERLNVSLSVVAVSRSTNQLLREQAANPHIDALIILDERGYVLNSSRQWPTTILNVAHHDYFKALHSNPALSFYIGEPVRSPATGEWVFTIARTILRADQKFAGVVLAVIRMADLEESFQAAETAAIGEITLLREDGVLLARYPGVEPPGTKEILKDNHSIVELLPQSKAGVLHIQSAEDGVERIVGYRLVNRYPLVVTVANRVNAILSDWREQAAAIMLFVLLMDLCLGAACVLGFRQIKSAARMAQVEGHLARHDPLTGLPNRMLFQEEIQAATERLASSPAGFAFHLLDLDGFKEVNDTYGHPAGDQLLKSVAARLKESTQGNGIVARLAGDEFAVIQNNVRTPGDASRFSACLLDSLSRPHQLQDNLVTVGVSIGIALAPKDGSTPEQLLKSADLALYSVKNDGRGAVQFHDAEMEAALIARRETERDLRQAVEADEFELFYQPILNLQTNDVAGFEALLRWHHPRRGLMLPNEFIPVAEATGLIGAIGALVIDKACREAATWTTPLRVAVNLSPIQFQWGDPAEIVTRSLRDSGLDGSRLELEITESALMEKKVVEASIERIRQMGVQIVLDDFGTGYASLAYLLKFPLKKLKIDSSFVSAMSRSSEGRNMVRGIIDLALRLDLPTVAEGVETQEQLAILRGSGCTEVQGYLIGRPMPAREIPSFLEERHWSAGNVVRLGERIS
jgi:diguanylate cyclase (GGDEF)-like protein